MEVLRLKRKENKSNLISKLFENEEKLKMSAYQHLLNDLSERKALRSDIDIMSFYDFDCPYYDLVKESESSASFLSLELNSAFISYFNLNILASSVSSILISEEPVEFKYIDTFDSNYILNSSIGEKRIADAMLNELFYNFYCSIRRNSSLISIIESDSGVFLDKSQDAERIYDSTIISPSGGNPEIILDAFRKNLLITLRDSMATEEEIIEYLSGISNPYLYSLVPMLGYSKRKQNKIKSLVAPFQIKK